MAGHDINYLALSGALSTFSGGFPNNILADFGGATQILNGNILILGVLIALYHRQ